MQKEDEMQKQCTNYRQRLCIHVEDFPFWYVESVLT